MRLPNLVSRIENFLECHHPFTILLTLTWMVVGVPFYAILFLTERRAKDGS